MVETVDKDVNLVKNKVDCKLAIEKIVIMKDEVDEKTVIDYLEMK